MAERENPGYKKEMPVERSTDVIRQDIAKKGDNISQTVEQLGERLKEKLDWREYVKGSPYWAMGAAAGLGYLASRIFRAHATPGERLAHFMAKEVHSSLNTLRVGVAGPSFIKATLLGIALKAAANWSTHAASTAAASDDAGLDLRQDAV